MGTFAPTRSVGKRLNKRRSSPGSSGSSLFCGVEGKLPLFLFLTICMASRACSAGEVMRVNGGQVAGSEVR